MIDTEYHGQIQLTWNERPETLHPASWGVRIKKMAILVVGGVLFGFLTWGFGWLMYAIGLMSYSTKWKGAGWFVGIAVSLFGIWVGFKALVGPCPYCRSVVGEGEHDITAGHENEHIHCGHCHELLVSHKGTIRALLPHDEETRETFPAPVFKGTVWPDECIACGKEVHHYEELKKSKLELSHLLVGQLSVSSGKINNVPYCSEHRGLLSLNVEDEKMFIEFPELSMQRRYLAVNRGQDVMKVKS